MSHSPKRRSEEPDGAKDIHSKRLRVDNNSDSDEAEEIPISISTNATPDSQIDHKAAIAYWSSTEPTVNGVLGGYPQVSRVDLQGSSNFLAKLRRQSKHFPSGKKLQRAVDCGAGIGRITTGCLSRVAEVVDIVEPVKSFTDKLEGIQGVGKIYNVGLEEWHPEKDGLGPYDMIWNQWCLGQLTDTQLIDYLMRLPQVLSDGGWIVVKENLSNHHLGQDVFDETDSSVTRTDKKFRQLFEDAGLKVVATELQKGLPQGLYPVRAYALQPRAAK
jgi:protein N-terminal methyltransferase